MGAVVTLRGWYRAETLAHSESWVCAYCGEAVSSRLGYRGGANDDGSSEAGQAGVIRICSNSRCLAPTYFPRHGAPSPVAPPGRDVAGLPTDIGRLYTDARRAAGAGAYTASVLASRKILMHVAVEKGAAKNGTFLSYVEHLSAENYLPPDGKEWVDYIRRRGNEANHEILVMNGGDAAGLIEFTEMLLKFIYEFPSRIPNPAAGPAAE